MKKPSHLLPIALLLAILTSCDSSNISIEIPPPPSIDIVSPEPPSDSSASELAPAWNAQLPFRGGFTEVNTYSRLEFPEDIILPRISEWNRSFTYRGGALTVNALYLLGSSRGSEESEVGIIALCDGIPVPFTVKGTEMEPSLFYNTVFTVDEQYTLQYSIDPIFTEDPGRVQILLLSDLQIYGSPTGGGSDFFVEGTLPEPETEIILVEKLETTEGVKNGFDWIPFSVRAKGSSKKMWRWMPTPDFTDNATIEMAGQTELICELTGSEPGRHRAVFFFDDQILTLPDGKLCVEWTQEDGKMAEYCLQLDGLLTPGAHRFFVIVTLLDDLSRDNARYTHLYSSAVLRLIP